MINEQLELPLEMEQLSLTFKKSVDSRVSKSVQRRLSGMKRGFVSSELSATNSAPRTSR